MKQVTICKVVENKLDNKVWKIIRCDNNKDIEGMITTVGMPYRAEDCKLGSEFKTIFTMED